MVRLYSFSERRIARHPLNATVTITLKPHREGCHRCTRRRFGDFGNSSDRDSRRTNSVPTLYDLFYHIFYCFVALLGITGTGASCINLILHLFDCVNSNTTGLSYHGRWFPASELLNGVLAKRIPPVKVENKLRSGGKVLLVSK